MKTVNIFSSNIPYQDQGQGEVIVLVNGLGRTYSHWLGFDQALAKNFRVISFDLRGVGTSMRPCTWQTSVEDMASDLIEVLDGLAIDKAHILGVSLGGMVAMACGIKYPQRCLSLTLINSSIGTKLLGDQRISIQALAFLSRSIFNKPEPLVHAKKLTQLVLSSDCKDEDRMRLAFDLARIENEQATDLSQVLKQSLAALRFRPLPKLAQMKVPTMIISGSDDRFVPQKNSQKIASFISHATTHVIEGGGHELTMDKAERILELQLAWISQLAARLEQTA